MPSNDADLFGKVVSDLEENIVIGEDAITGNSKYISDYTGFDSDPDNQKGNFLAIHVKGINADTVEAGLDPSASTGLVVIPDGEDDIVVRLSDDTEQTFVVKVTKDNQVNTLTYDLTELVREEPPVVEG